MAAVKQTYDIQMLQCQGPGTFLHMVQNHCYAVTNHCYVISYTPLLLLLWQVNVSNLIWKFDWAGASQIYLNLFNSAYISINNININSIIVSTYLQESS